MKQELAMARFHQWFTKNGNYARIFIVLACSDLEMLNILQSSFAGFQLFEAPFSESANSMIFWGSFLSIFSEDLPQVFIQVGI